ncbi:uncharacterized protein CTRU02_213543 [Colletotrichum truncatum]|uniref:Uncharacterized protein n=1 Tax=Colletotrichum truncatum TaxID=5467 RepID=A0ACC3YG30_COLTU|nr:uncharacterized protein CTRU02_12492 [Colletotrichum truncatum]KAF6784503.1 hypothetical protein CTRU02_12492 [Colletotrichum truncatum]
MTIKQRKYTLCEWALGVSVEEYCDSAKRRPRKESRGRPRISVEISTDEESEEETVKITYPSSGCRKLGAQPSKIKKVRFQKATPKPALRSSSIGTNSSGDSKPDPDCKCRDCTIGRRKLRKTGKGNKENDVETEISQAEEESHGREGDRVRPKGEKKSRETKEKKKATVVSSEGDTEIETTETDTESEDETPPSPKDKKQKNSKNTKQNARKSRETPAPVGIESNNVGPTKKKAGKSGSTKGEINKSKGPEKVRPEATLSPHLRRPNLIMPVRAEVLQVEHTIEGAEDPRPNAFHDPQHGVVRVYHGPAYGNPYGLLYPVRDSSRATLPIGVPHPLQNPYFLGFAKPENPGDNHFRGRSPWAAVPVTYKPGFPPTVAPIDPTEVPRRAYWTAVSPNKSIPVEEPQKPVMSGANQDDSTSTAAKNKEKGWDTNVGPESRKIPTPTNSVKTKPLNSNVAPNSPININLTVNPDTPWAAFANTLSKAPDTHKTKSQSGGRDGSNNGSKKSWGSKKATAEWQPLPSGEHPDLEWGMPPKSLSANDSGWGQAGDGNNDTWGVNGGSGSNHGRDKNNNDWSFSANGYNNGGLGCSGNAQNSGNQDVSGGDNVWATAANGNTWDGSGNDSNQMLGNDDWVTSTKNASDPWANIRCNYNNGATTSNYARSNESNRSHNSGRDNRSASGQTKPDSDWYGRSNNVGVPAVASGSNRSRQSQKSQAAPINGGWDGNVGPMVNIPTDTSSKKSNESRRSSKKGSVNGDPWNTKGGDTSTWITDNNAGPTTNSPNASQISKKNETIENTWPAGDGAGWGPNASGGHNPTGTEVSKGSGSNKSMPGAWDNNLPWGDTSLAQSTGGLADTW